MEQAIKKEIAECTAWPANSEIDLRKPIKAGTWGYLIYYKGEIVPDFDLTRRPSDEEIIERWGSKLKEELKQFGVLAKKYGDKHLSLDVLQSAAGFYLGTQDNGEPNSRESVEYWPEKAPAEIALLTGEWNQREHP